MPNYLNYKDAKLGFEKLSSKYRLTANYDNYMTELWYEDQLVMTNHHPGDCPATEVMFGFALNYLPFGRKAYMLMAELAMTPWGYLEDKNFVAPLFIDFNLGKMTLLAYHGSKESQADFPFNQTVINFGDDIPKECLLTTEQLKIIGSVSGDEYKRYDQTKIKPSQLDERVSHWKKVKPISSPKPKDQNGYGHLNETLKKLSNLQAKDGFTYIKIGQGA